MKKNLGISSLLGLLALIGLLTLAGCGEGDKGPAGPPGPQGSSWSLSTEVVFDESGKPLPPSIMPVYFLSGTDYEMGYQYGSQAAPYMRAFMDHGYAKFLSRPYADTLEKRDAILKGFQYHVKKYAPYFIDMMKGIAAGMTDAGYPATYAEVLLMQCEWEATFDPAIPEKNYPSPVDSLPPMMCSSFVASGKTTNKGQLVYGQSSDGTPFKWEGTIVAFPKTGNNYIVDGEIGVVALNYMVNSKGVVLGLNASGGKRVIDTQFGLTMPFMHAHIARFANSAAEARDMLLNTQLAWGVNYITADLTGAMFVVEATAAVKAQRGPGTLGEGEIDFLVNTNHFRIPEMIATTGQTDGRACLRYKLLFNYLKENLGKVDLEFGKMMFRNPPVCKASNRIVRVVQIDGSKILSHTSTGPAYKADDVISPINAKYEFYEIDLKGTPADIVAAAESTARTYLKNANNELNKLAPTDPKYDELYDLLDLAKSKYYAGLNHQNSAAVRTGNEAIFSYSKAMMAYTQSHVVALQAYHVVVPVRLTP